MASMVYVKNPKGRTYVYENVTLWNKETKKYIHRRKCIGHLGEDGKEILPNRKKGIPAKPEQPVSFVGVPFTASFAREAVEEFRGSIRHHKNYCRVLDDDLYAATKPFQWGGHRCYLHIYHHDSLKAEIASKRFDRELLSCYDELKQDKLVHAHEEYYKKFLLVKDTPKRGRKVEYKEDAIQKHKQNTLGWFVLITNDIKDPSQALTVYRQKDAVEKGFDDLKNDLDMKRLRIHSEAAMDGRIFLQFLAHILVTRIKVVMNEHGWFKNHDLQEVLDEMKSIREVRMEGRRKSVTTTLTKFQSQIAQLFGLVF